MSTPHVPRGEPGTGYSAPRRPTSYDVARLAGTSQSAVSRCFTPDAHISTEKRAKILRAAKDLGYQPSAVARELITGQSHLVGCVISEQSSRAYPELLYSLTRSLGRLDMRVVLVALPQRDLSPADLAPLRAQRIAGVVLAADLPEPLVRAILEDGLQIVQYNRSSPGLPLSVVTCDHNECGRTLAQYLVEAGHRRFGLIEGPVGSSVAAERLVGVSERLLELGLPRPIRIPGDFSYEAGVSAATRLVRPDAGRLDVLIAANDLMALGALDALRHRLGMTVPGDISVAAFDGVEAGRWIGYDLTTMRQPLARMADATAELLVSRLRDRHAPAEKRLFTGEIIKGSSARLTAETGRAG